MPATTNSGADAYKQIRATHHPDCVVCSPDNAKGLAIAFHVADDRSVEAAFDCKAMLQGYPAMLHGGVVSTLLDGAMTNCLFAHGHISVTVELNVRFRHPVTTLGTVQIRAWLVSSNCPVHAMAAELIQNNQVKATAKARFFERVAIGRFGRNTR